jgi:acyl carrier protein
MLVRAFCDRHSRLANSIAFNRPANDDTGKGHRPKSDHIDMDTAEPTSPSQAQDLISGVLNGPPPRLSEDVALGDIPGWDSVVMVRLVVAIEERLGRQLSDLELEAIETIGDVETLLKARRLL